MRAVDIPTNLMGFFNYFVIFTEPLHKLGKQEKRVLAQLLYQRHLIKKKLKKESYLVDKLLFDYDTKQVMCTELGIDKNRFAIILTTLRKAGIVKGRKLNKMYIPGLQANKEEYILQYKFNISYEEEKAGSDTEEDGQKTQTDSS